MVLNHNWVYYDLSIRFLSGSFEAVNKRRCRTYRRNNYNDFVSRRKKQNETFPKVIRNDP